MKSNRIFHIICLLCVFLFDSGLKGQEASFQKKMKELELLIYNNPDQAIETGLKISQTVKPQNYVDFVSINLFLGEAYAAKQEYSKALFHGKEAYNKVKNTSHYTEQIKSLGFLANQYYVLQRDDQLNYYLNQSEQMLYKHNLPEEFRYLAGNVYFIRALNYKENLDCNFAITYFNKAINEYKFSKSPNKKVNLSVIYIQKAYCQLDFQQLDSAKSNFLKAYQISSKYQITENIVYAQLGLANVLTAKKQFRESITAINKIDSLYPHILNGEKFKSLSEIYLLMHDNNRYLYYVNNYVKIQHQINQRDIDYVTDIWNLNNKSNFEDYSQEKNKKIAFVVVISLFLIAIIVFLVIFLKKNINNKKSIS